ncbi:SDR family NAD(P)-dependent oxidoreductase [Paeniglutamicibacter sulfureus]|uniref:SDR family NAD(P)-dependent oxidoreductase n=1 Tax=Paeniglutamicibacter sulfureus TaxID=43666 RepID=UPI002666555F|nr:SDR family NAD(P)-dependent oxidoreductase [Paeniglutamicibacter sulfureus]MDO2934657.1 SDR family NAD(P)-dependent oxidoreductase [Paeniglutamicibacter sulfureus]
MSAKSLNGKTAIVTGGARGIGRAYALRLAQLGADVAVVDQNVRSYEEYDAENKLVGGTPAEEALRKFGRKAESYTCDVTEEDSVKSTFDQIAAEFGSIDIVVCNAGGGSGTPATTLASSVDPSDFTAVVERNLYGTYFTCRAAVPHMRDNGWGRIITVSSQAGRRADRGGGYAHYGAAKAGIIMYTKYLAQELGPAGITVNCVAPGYIATGRLSVMFESMGSESLTDEVALRRFGTPEDCADVLQFLATDQSSYVTGTVIPIDGGTTEF